MLARRVTRVELSREWADERTNGEKVYRVWYEDKYEYVWAKDELEAFKRATRNDHEDTQSK